MFNIVNLIVLLILSNITNGTADRKIACVDVCKCDLKKTKVNCDNEALYELPSDLPKNTTVLYLSNNYLDSDAMRNLRTDLPNLTQLRIKHNVLMKGFQLPESLQTLHAENNRLQEISDFFINGDKLKDAYLEGNNITVLRNATFAKSSNLRLVFLTSNPMTTIEPQAFIGLEKLNALRMDSILISKLHPYVFGENMDFTLLELANNPNLRRLPEGVFVNARNKSRNQYNINEMKLSNSIVSVIDEGFFDGVFSVRNLFMDSMRLKDLPPKLFAKTRIRSILDLSVNQLTQLPDFFLELSSELKTLYLDQNNISYISNTTFAGLFQLQKLYLFRNRIHDVASNAFFSTNISLLYLFNNNITKLRGVTFATSNKSLQILHLFHNRIADVSKQAFDQMKPNATVYLSSLGLGRAPMVNARDVNILFVDDSINTTFTVTNGRVAIRLRHQGFDCRDKVCWLCPKGTYGNGIDEDCTKCPTGSGYYQNETGQLSDVTSSTSMESIQCKKCNNGTYVTINRTSPATSPLDCEVCPSGTNKEIFSFDRACACLQNYTRRSRFGLCEPCPPSGINCDEEYQQIAKGYFWTWEWPNYTDWKANLNAYQSFASNLRTSGFKYHTKRTFHGALPKAHPCPLGEHTCSDVAIVPSCNDGYDGWLCASCKTTSSWNTSYYSWFQKCHACPPPWKFALSCVAMVLILITICIIIWYSRKTQREGRSFLDIFLAQFKIVLGFYQVVGAIYSAMNNVPWPATFTRLGSILKILEFNLLQLIGKPHCYFETLKLNAYLEFDVAMSLVCVVLLIPVILYWLKVLQLKYKVGVWNNFCNEEIQKFKKKCIFFIIVMLFITYPGLCNVTLTLLPTGCTTYFLDENHEYSVRKLSSDLSIDCETNVHTVYTKLAFVALAYVIGFPLVLFLILWKHRSQIKHLKIKKERAIPLGEPNNNFQSVDDLEDYTCIMDNEISESSINTYDADEDSENSSDPLIQERVHNADKVSLWLAFLCENYKADYWYWEIVELTRKVLQIALLVMFGSRDTWYFAVTVAISVVYLTSHAYFKPMENTFDHALQMSSLVSIFLNLLIAAALMIPDDENQTTAHDVTISVSLIVLNTGVVLAVIANGLLRIIRTVRRRGRGCCSSCHHTCLMCVGLLVGTGEIAAASSGVGAEEDENNNEHSRII